MKLIGIGCGRKVYALSNKFVIKIPYNNYGRNQAKLEYQRWKESKQTNLLAKIYFYIGGIIIMERLHNCCVYNGEVKKYLPFIRGKGAPIGQDQKGNWKLFDYGDYKPNKAVKISQKNIELINRFRLNIVQNLYNN